MTSPESAPESKPKTFWVGLDVATANIGRGHTDTYRAKNIERLRNAQARGFVMGLQEIDEADGKVNSDGEKGDEHLDLRRSMPNYRWAKFKTHVPIGVPEPWEIVEQYQQQGHPGMAGYSPDRPIITALLRHKATGIEYVHINSHVVRLGPTGGRLEDRKILWNEWWSKVKAEVKKWADKGYLVIFTADANNPALPKIHPQEKRLVHNGLDYILAVEGGAVKVEKKSVHHVDLTIDGHNAHIANLRLTEVAA